jgi:hypothetical protein
VIIAELSPFHLVLLRVLYFLGCIEPNYCSKTTLLCGLPAYEANKACQELLRWNYIKLADYNEDMVSLNPEYIQEIRRHNV